MGERLRRFYLNVGLFASLRLLLAHVFFAAVLLLILIEGIGWHLAAIPALVWLLPRFFRRVLIEHPRRVMALHDRALIGMMLVGAVLRGPIKALGELGLLLVLTCLAALIGVHWWLLSDPAIRTPRSPE